MTEIEVLQRFLDHAHVADAVYALRPDYRVLLLVVDGLPAGENDGSGEELLQQAEQFARDAVAERSVEQLPHIAAWRDAYRAFGAKPQRTRNSLEALTRRAVSGLPRVNRLTDIYNAVSVLHQVPLGGEDLTRYRGSPRLVRATGAEPFDTTADGEAVLEHPEAGEVVWCDEVGVTCRRWNWRQGRRTQLTDRTSTALFILDGLDPASVADLHATADALVQHLSRLGPDVTVIRRLLTGNDDNPTSAFAPSDARST